MSHLQISPFSTEAEEAALAPIKEVFDLAFAPQFSPEVAVHAVLLSMSDGVPCVFFSAQSTLPEREVLRAVFQIIFGRCGFTYWEDDVQSA